MTQENYSSENKLLELIENLENKKRQTAAVVFHDDEQKLFSEFKKIFSEINAAGGVVFNPAGELLMIFRKGKWDLPKGKIEPREEKIKAAEREVKEETGLSKTKVESLLRLYPWNQECTIHTYWEARRRVLKKTYWYKMVADSKSKFSPQKEEGITEVKWMNKKNIAEALKQSYASVDDVVRFAI